MHSYIAVCGRGAVVGGHRGTGARQMTESFIAGEPGTAACRVRSGPPAVSVPTAHTHPPKLHPDLGPKSWFPTFAILSL